MVLSSVLYSCGSHDTSNNQETNDSPVTQAQLAKEGWIESNIIDLDQLNKEKPVFVFFWTTWCKGCKQTERWYFEEPEIYDYLAENYHLVKINGDTTKITIKGREYARSMENKAKHELNLEFGQKWKGYPNILIFDEELNFITAFEPQVYMGRPAKHFLVKLDSIINI